MTVVVGAVCFIIGLMCGIFLMCLVTVGKSRRLSYYESKFRDDEAETIEKEQRKLKTNFENHS